MGDDARLSEFDLPEEVTSAWDDPPVRDHPDRPDPETIHLPEDRRAHILDGDPDGHGGGHRHGTGRAMNEAEFVTAMKQLPERYVDRVPDRHLDGMRLMAEGGEWEELIDNLAASLRQTQHPVTSAERDELAALLSYMNLPSEWLYGLAVAGG